MYRWIVIETEDIVGAFSSFFRGLGDPGKAVLWGFDRHCGVGRVSRCGVFQGV